jgi:hydroxymethylbilane synthase
MTQTQWVVQRLHQQWPDLDVEIEQIHTTGDKVTNVPLSQIGGDGVFVTEIERALHERRIDLAVHSLKDLPTVQPDDLRLVVTGPREDVRDVFVSRELFQLSQLFHTSPQGTLVSEHMTSPTGAHLRIGTCSLRRTAQLHKFVPDAQILSLRGNVDTRVRKLEAGDYDGIVLAAAGLLRLGMQERLAGRMTYLPLEMMLPAPGQGALAIECRAEPQILELLAPLRDASVQAATSAERMFMRRLGAGCYLPVAAHGEISEGSLTLRGLVASLDGARRIEVQQRIPWTLFTPCSEAEALGVRVAELALEQGAQAIIQELSGPRDREQIYG